MSEASILAMGAVSGLGTGGAACSAGLLGTGPALAIARDPLLADAGLARPMAARAPSELGPSSFEDRACTLLACALEQLCAELDERRPTWRTERIGVAIGTSSGGMLSVERWFHARAAGEQASIATLRRATYFAPYADALGWVGIEVGAGGAAAGPRWEQAARVVPVRATQVLAACASSTLAIGLGFRWLARDLCDLVIAGGYDAVSLFVAAGFEALRATTASVPRPFRLERDGMSLGEGAGVVALGRCEGSAAARYGVRLSGFGASNEAVHITAPDRTGAGLARAAQAALREAGPGVVDLVSAHGTATPYNDAMEARAIRTACGSEARPIVHPFKAQIGHTLGAAGVLELLVAVDALDRGLAPAAAGEGTPIDPDAAVALLDHAELRPLGRALKLSAAFAGVTAALVLDRTRDAPSGSPQERGAVDGRAARAADAEALRVRPRPVYLHAHRHVRAADPAALAGATGLARDRIARIDELGQLSLGAVAALVDAVGSEAVAGAGIVMGHALATLDVNERFHARLRARGPRFVDPRLFPATTPNAAAGHCAIVYGLTGPSFAVGGGLGGGLEALVAAAELVAAGDAEAVIVLSADEPGPLSEEWLERLGCGDRPCARGAVAALIAASPPAGPADARVVPLDLPVDHGRGPIGHLGLLAWLVG